MHDIIVPLGGFKDGLNDSGGCCALLHNIATSVATVPASAIIFALAVRTPDNCVQIWTYSDGRKGTLGNWTASEELEFSNNSSERLVVLEWIPSSTRRPQLLVGCSTGRLLLYCLAGWKAAGTNKLIFLSSTILLPRNILKLHVYTAEDTCNDEQQHLNEFGFLILYDNGFVVDIPNASEFEKTCHYNDTKAYRIIDLSQSGGIISDVGILNGDNSCNPLGAAHLNNSIFQLTDEDHEWLLADESGADIRSSLLTATCPNDAVSVELTNRRRNKKLISKNTSDVEIETRHEIPINNNSSDNRGKVVKCCMYVTVGRDPYISLNRLLQTCTSDDVAEVEAEAVGDKPNQPKRNAVSSILSLGVTAAVHLLSTSRSTDRKEEQLDSPFLVSTRSDNDTFKANTRVTNILTFRDSGRTGTSVHQCPWNKTYGLVADCLGRVSFVCLSSFVVHYMWKGFRDAKVCWLWNSNSYTAMAILYAPKRGILEVWDTVKLTRLSAQDVGTNGTLLGCQDCSVCLFVTESGRAHRISGTTPGAA